MAVVKNDGKWGAINIKGEIIVLFVYDKSFHFSEGLAALDQNSKSSFINKTGTIVIPCIYDAVGDYWYPTLEQGIKAAYLHKTLDVIMDGAVFCEK